MRKLFIFLFLIGFITSCAFKNKVPDFKAYVTLPASGNGFYVQTASEGEGVIPKKQWDEKKKRGIILFSEDYLIIKNSVSKVCNTTDCKDFLGVFDNLFYTLDEALKKTK